MTSSLLTTHHTVKLPTTHHTIMAHLHYTFSPGDLADSIAGHITGESAKECIEKATIFLTKFGFSAVPMSRLNWQQQQQPSEPRIRGIQHPMVRNGTRHF